MKKWFNYDEVALLTYGTVTLTAENILKVVEFSGSETHTNMFKKYLSEAPPKILQNFLKFTTGTFFWSNLIFVKVPRTYPLEINNIVFM